MLDTKPIIFTDLDGTLLDHHTYSFEPARAIITYLTDHDIPIIFVTSKTKNEARQLQKTIGIAGPAIVENGAGIVYPDSSAYDDEPLGKTYDEILSAVAEFSSSTSLRGFSQMTVTEVAHLTSLDDESAALAKQRAFTEPFILSNESELADLTARAEQRGLAIVRGGRFYHLITAGQDKAVAMRRVQEKHFPGTRSIALGDGPNDRSMLAEADLGVVIPRPDGTCLTADGLHVIQAPYPGPAGWAAVIKEQLNVA